VSPCAVARCFHLEDFGESSASAAFLARRLSSTSSKCWYLPSCTGHQRGGAGGVGGVTGGFSASRGGTELRGAGGTEEAKKILRVLRNASSCIPRPSAALLTTAPSVMRRRHTSGGMDDGRARALLAVAAATRQRVKNNLRSHLSCGRVRVVRAALGSCRSGTI